MKKMLIAAFVAGCVSAGAHAESLLAGNAASGKKLHDADCVKCHGSEVYTRKDRRVKTIPGLIGQVDMCVKNLSKSYSEAQRTDLVKYLNDAFYKFE